MRLSGLVVIEGRCQVPQTRDTDPSLLRTTEDEGGLSTMLAWHGRGRGLNGGSRALWHVHPPHGELGQPPARSEHVLSIAQPDLSDSALDEGTSGDYRWELCDGAVVLFP